MLLFFLIWQNNEEMEVKWILEIQGTTSNVIILL